MAHDHAHVTSTREEAQARALWIAFALTASIAVVELVGGFLFRSLALTADAAHMLSDAGALGVALTAQYLASRPASPRHSFGWRRAEVVAAQLNGLLLMAAAVWIVVEAADRLDAPVEVEAGGMIAVATVGLLANIVSTALLRRAPGNNINVRAAALHTLSDAAGSVGALVAGFAIVVWEADWADAAASIFIAALVVVAAARLLIDTTHLLMEGTPRHLDPEEVEAALREDPSVVAVHHLHVWAVSPDEPALSAHIELDGTESLHEAQEHGRRLKEMLAERFGVDHSTLELECHPCAPEEQEH